MAVSEVNVAGSFLSEVQWARDTIIEIKERKMRSAPLGLVPGTRQPDKLFHAFAQRDLLFSPYVRAEGLTLGTPDAYTVNISTIASYVERERREELVSVHHELRNLAATRAAGLSVGLSLPDGQLDDYARYFVIRGIPIDVYFRGRVELGSPAAYETNAARLQDYLRQVTSASYH